MRMRDRSAVLLIILAVALFAISWPINSRISNPETWHSQKVKDRNGNLKSWRPPRGEGENFFNVIFQGGGGTPAILAMFGGQRYLIANIMWTYSDILFHQSGEHPEKIYEMAKALEAVVTLNPSFGEAWSVYGWHLAWNLNADSENLVMKDYWLKNGEKVYLRAIEANPDKPMPYFDLAWLYLQRMGNYQEAEKYLKYMYDNFEPLKQDAKKPLVINPLELDRKWDPKTVGHRLAYVYKLQGIAYAAAGDPSGWEYIQKSIDVYQKCLDVEPTDDTAKDNLNDLKKHLRDEAWMKDQIAKHDKIRQSFGMTPLAAYANEVGPRSAHGEGKHTDDDGHDHDGHDHE
ncbi:MAG: tetratricopeptide repeat protein [Armatimonadota bacterium]